MKTKKIAQTKLKSFNMALVTHELTTGPPHDLQSFLVSRVASLLFIAHPLIFMPKDKKRKSRCEKYYEGRLIQEKLAFHWSGCPELLLYLKDCFYTLFWSLVSERRYDLFIGLGGINALIGLVLKKLGRVKKVIFYCIDYVPQRFGNRWLNNFYHFIDKICVENCNITWNLSPRMAEGREKRWKKGFLKQTVVPHGVHFNRIKRLPFNKINKKEIIYMGTILEKQGIQLVIGALPEIRRKIKEIHFTIIGNGPYEGKLKDLVKKLKLEGIVTFTGYIKSHKELENRLAKGAVGVALYNPDIDQFSYYADPGKVKNYLGAGLPVIITDVPYIAKEIKKAKCGIVVNYNKEDVARAVIKVMKNEDKLKIYRKNAVEYAKQFDWNKIFNKHLGNLKYNSSFLNDYRN